MQLVKKRSNPLNIFRLFMKSVLLCNEVSQARLGLLGRQRACALLETVVVMQGLEPRKEF